jgi:hypothetical protein
MMDAGSRLAIVPLRANDFAKSRAAPQDLWDNASSAPPPAVWPFTMLYTLAVVLILLWLLGYLSSYDLGGFIHVLLVIAVILFLVRLISGRKMNL